MKEIVVTICLAAATIGCLIMTDKRKDNFLWGVAFAFCAVFLGLSFIPLLG